MGIAPFGITKLIMSSFLRAHYASGKATMKT